MKPPRRKQERPTDVDVLAGLLVFSPPPGSFEVKMRAHRVWSAERRAFVTERGLPRSWWWFWIWSPEAQRRFLDAGGTPPPRAEAVGR